MTIAAPNAVLKLPLNQEGRDFVVGDIHGMHHLLEEALAAVAFDTSKDRLFCVGDLIDRGPNSHRSLALLQNPWVFAVRGNHEETFLEEVWQQELTDIHFWLLQRFHGMDWVKDHPQAFLDELGHVFNQLPYAIELQDGEGAARVGIIHAEVPFQATWQEFCAKLEKGDEPTRSSCTWGRTRIRHRHSARIKGVDYVVVGHTIVEAPHLLGNVVPIDTGAFLRNNLDRDEGALCLLQIGPAQASPALDRRQIFENHIWLAQIGLNDEKKLAA